MAGCPHCRKAYEVWAGMDGTPIPETAPEGYYLQIIKDMREAVSKGLTCNQNNETEQGGCSMTAAELAEKDPEVKRILKESDKIVEHLYKPLGELI